MGKRRSKNKNKVRHKGSNREMTEARQNKRESDMQISRFVFAGRQGNRSRQNMGKERSMK